MCLMFISDPYSSCTGEYRVAVLPVSCLQTGWSLDFSLSIRYIWLDGSGPWIFSIYPQYLVRRKGSLGFSLYIPCIWGSTEVDPGFFSIFPLYLVRRKWSLYFSLYIRCNWFDGRGPWIFLYISAVSGSTEVLFARVASSRSELAGSYSGGGGSGCKGLGCLGITNTGRRGEQLEGGGGQICCRLYLYRHKIS
jgi:hypothetical protein